MPQWSRVRDLNPDGKKTLTDINFNVTASLAMTRDVSQEVSATTDEMTTTSQTAQSSVGKLFQ